MVVTETLRTGAVLYPARAHRGKERRFGFSSVVWEVIRKVSGGLLREAHGVVCQCEERYGNRKRRFRSRAVVIALDSRDETRAGDTGSPTILRVWFSTPQAAVLGTRSWIPWDDFGARALRFAWLRRYGAPGAYVINNMMDDPEAPAGGFKYSARP